ncbi:MAG: histidine phosphotransferase family protein, partial [Pseudomonadota bacterium]
MTAPFDIDPVRLSALLASRVCHDLINPAGALAAGIEVLDDEGDPGMREEAIRLIRVSAAKAVDQLTFARIAFGAGGAFADQLELSEARIAAQGWFKHIKPDLDWRLADGMASKGFCKITLCALLAAADCVPRGGTVMVEGGGSSVWIVA